MSVAGDYITQNGDTLDKEDDDTSSMHSKAHFSKNARLLDPKTVATLQKQSARLSPRTNDPPAARVPKLAIAPISKAQPKKSVEVAETALERFQRYVPAKVDGTPKEAIEPKPVVYKKGSKVKKSQVAERQADIPPTASTSATASNFGDEPYSPDITLAWYELQGSKDRKNHDLEVANKKRKTVDEPLLQVMKEKTIALARMSNSMDVLGQAAKASSTSTGQAVCSPEQLWADALVPQMLRMTDDIRDEFMQHVFSVALKAIRGKWPTGN